MKCILGGMVHFAEIRLLEWIPKNQVGHLKFSTQRYTQYHAILYLSELTGHIYEKSGEIRVGDGCARKRVEYRVWHRRTVIRVKHCFKNG